MSTCRIESFIVMSRRRGAKSPSLVMEDEEFTMPVILAMIAKCHEAKAIQADVGRLYKAKEWLGLQNWDADTSTPMKIALVSCFEQRVFYKSTQGINFLSFVLGMHPSLVQPINAKLKKCILSFPAVLVGGCSQVLFKAWSSSTGGQRMVLEQVITEWMKKALFCSVRIAERVRYLLSTLHSSMRTPLIDELLSRYYGPVLFRHTKVANWEVRFNAIALLAAAFPVMQPERTTIEFEEKLTFQFRVLKDAMEDPNESVRKCAVRGVGRILSEFWELLTIEQIAMVLDTMVQKCGRDKKSFQTRICVIDALSGIMSNPLTHGVMTEVLPGTLSLFHDENPFVRLKYCQFLNDKLMKLNSVSIVAIVPHGALLARLAYEHTLGMVSSARVHKDIAKCIGSMISRSLFVSVVDDQVARCELMAGTVPQGLLALVANAGESITELERTRLAVAVFSKVIDNPEKVSSNRILLRLVAELLRSTQLSGVQNTEDKFAPESHEGKLCGFVYKHLNDRQIVTFAKKMREIGPGIVNDLIEVLATLDGARLAHCYQWINEVSGENAAGGKIACIWGSSGAVGDAWKLVTLREPNTVEQVDAQSTLILVSSIKAGLDLRDFKTLAKQKDQIINFLNSVASRFPNLKFIPTFVSLFELSLSALLMVAINSEDHDEAVAELQSVLHRLAVGLIGSVNVSPLTEMPALKKSRKKKDDVPSDPIEIAFLPKEMGDIVVYYLYFLITAALLTGIPLKTTKFDDLYKVLWMWVEKDGQRSDEIITKIATLLDLLIKSKQGASIAVIVAQAALSHVGPNTSEELLRSLLKKVIYEFQYSHELNYLIAHVNDSRTLEIAKSIVTYMDNPPPSLTLALGIKDYSTANSLRQSLVGQ